MSTFRILAHIAWSFPANQSTSSKGTHSLDPLRITSPLFVNIGVGPLHTGLCARFGQHVGVLLGSRWVSLVEAAL